MNRVFYLLDMGEQDGGRIVAAFNAKSVTEMPAETTVSTRWNPSGVAVGLFISGKLSAVFDLRTDTPQVAGPMVKMPNFSARIELQLTTDLDSTHFMG